MLRMNAFLSASHNRPLTPVSPQAVGPRHWPKGPRMSRPSGLKCALHLARLILAMYLKLVRCLEVSPILSISLPFPLSPPLSPAATLIFCAPVLRLAI